MHRQPLFRAILLGLCLGALPGAAQAEMLQFATADGTKSWPKLPDIPDWHQDQESSLRLAANSLIPDGVDPANAEMTIQARGFPRRGNADITSLSQLVDSDRAGSDVKNWPTSRQGRHALHLMLSRSAGKPGIGSRGLFEEGEYPLALLFGALPGLTMAAYIFTTVKYAGDPW